MFINTYNVRQFAGLIGVSVKTLQRTPGNRRLYTDEHLALVGRASRIKGRITAAVLETETSCPAQPQAVPQGAMSGS